MKKIVPNRTGARRMNAVPAGVLRDLAAGRCETVNLMEWLAADMGKLARNVAKSLPEGVVRSALRQAAREVAGQGVTFRLKILGRAIAADMGIARGSDFRVFSEHRSDLVRQWACYAVNDQSLGSTLKERLQATLVFASDPNMSVREAAWMAFRPHVQANLDESLGLLTDLAGDDDFARRRFAVEVTRPRSVWGEHLKPLKRDPELALALLRKVRCDPSKYVQLAVGNWINDASKSRPDWALQICAEWMQSADPNTRKIVFRGLRTLRMQRQDAKLVGELIPTSWPAVLEIN
jgi:3-methyladenine DNA glycosylase AlkC